jgi:Glycosyltransferase like family
VRRFAFLTCVREDALYDRLRSSIDALERPEGVELGLFTEREERNLSAAYNRLQAAAAGWRYKAYLHDDVVILNRRLVGDVLRIFRDRRVALIGVAGCRYLPESCVWWDGSGVVGKVVHLVGDRREALELEEPASELERVEAVDGVFMATQHDLPWDEEIPGFHFYDVAQSTRYLLAGCDVVVPRQVEPWLAHEHRPGAPPAEYAASQAAFRRRYHDERARFAASRVRRKVRRLTAALRPRSR